MISFLYPFLILATSANLSFGQPPTMIPVGEEFKVPISLSSGGRETIGTDAVLLFDPKILSATKIEKGKIYPNYPPNLEDIDNVHGKVSFSGTVGFGLPKTVEGLFGEVFFRSKKPGTTQISFAWEGEGTADSNIVPSFGSLDLLTEKPEKINLVFREASLGEKILAWIKRIFSFDYLRF